MKKPTRRKSPASRPRARRNSARLFAVSAKKKSSSSTHMNSKGLSGSDLGKSIPLWTKESPKSSSERSLFVRFFAAIGRGVAFVFLSLFRAIASVFGFIFSLIRRSRIALALIAVCAVVLVIGLVDFGMNSGKVYPGVMVGEVDLGGKTSAEAEKLLEDTYAHRLTDTQIYIFANEEASKDLEAALAQTNDQAYAEQHSVEETQANKLVWETDAANLGAALDTQALVAEAMDHGRDEGGFPARFNAWLFGHTIEPRARYNDEAVEALSADIDATIGEPRVNFDIEIIDGQASVTEGHDGDMINRASLKAKFDEILLLTEEKTASFVAQTEYAPLQITKEMAEETRDRVNASIAHGAEFSFSGSSWEAQAKDLGSWTNTRVSEIEGTWKLVPYLDYDRAKSSMFTHLKANLPDSEIHIRFSKEDEDIIVHTDTQGTLPQSREAIADLNTLIFEHEEIPSEKPIIHVGEADIPPTLDFQEALDTGIISMISEFTTEYTANVTNRNHNIRLVSDLLDSSIVSPDGTWSFNETAGNCNEEAGFKGAGSIIDGEYVDEIGGGICQVATTVFNAVYDAGFPVLQRHNHSLYIASYPAGRDAAVSWPDLDLRWENDSGSDVILLTSYTDTTITVSLYGVNPEYQVSTVTGNWEPGEEFKTRTITDETMTPGSSYVKSYGTNGSSIVVTRTVKDRYDTILREDVFSSIYVPKDEVKVEGPKLEEKKDEEAEEKKKEESAEEPPQT